MRRQPEKNFAWLAAAFCLVELIGCNPPLPEQGTHPAQLYVRRCGNCHRPYNPRSLTAAMWEVQVQMMERKMVQYRMPPLTDEERENILGYLTRNSDHQ